MNFMSKSNFFLLLEFHSGFCELHFFYILYRHFHNISSLFLSG